jgi:hypothetical protein
MALGLPYREARQFARTWVQTTFVRAQISLYIHGDSLTSAAELNSSPNGRRLGLSYREARQFVRLGYLVVSDTA